MNLCGMSDMKEGGNYKHGESVQVNQFAIDLLPAFVSRKSSALNLDARQEVVEEDEEDIELSLGLSLNGQFGFDPKRENRLSRSSSIPDFMTAAAAAEIHKSVAVKSLLPSAQGPLSRAYSLPTESEEWRKRKELQSLRRFEAKRKRMEKLKSPRTGRDLVDNNGKKGPGPGHGEFSLPFGLPKSSWADNNGGHGTVIKSDKPPLFRQGSIGSQGSGSSGISESECLPPQGRTVANRKVEESIVVGQVKEEGFMVGSDEAKEMLKKVLLDMPYVSTTGEGADGKKIEGFLYRYKKGEEAMIVCVCHGTFFSPAEFVKHGGGPDVSHPLRHIIVRQA